MSGAGGSAKPSPVTVMLVGGGGATGEGAETTGEAGTPSARANPPAVSNRSRGSLAIATARMLSNTPSSGETCEGTGTGSLMWANSVADGESRGYGTCPVRVT